MSGVPDSQSSGELLADVIRREQALLDPNKRADGEFVATQLHPEFVEYGASGRTWDRDTIVAQLASNPATIGDASDFAAVLLADNVVLVTYLVEGEASSLRSSIWVREADREWSLRFHQGTPTQS